MASPLLTHRHIFGLKSDVGSNIHFVEDNVLLYPAGHNVIIYNLETKQQRFIHGSESSNDHKQGRPEIVSLAVSPNKRYVAVGERGTDRSICTIYDVKTLKRKKTLVTNELESKEFISMCFSPDGKTILTQGGHPDWTLIHWTWQKPSAKPLQIINLPITAPGHYQCSFCPSDASLVCVTGKQCLLYFRIEQGSNKFKPYETSMYDQEPENYLCHDWTTGKRMIAGSAEGNLVFLENTMFRGILPSSPGEGQQVTCIKSYANGFVIGNNEGKVTVYVRDEEAADGTDYKLLRSFELEKSAKVTSISISPSNDNLAITLDDSRAYLLKLFDTDVLKPDDIKFELLGAQNHNGRISGMDVCVRKPLLITCGADKTVRIYDYLKKTDELVMRFTEEPHSVAFHPSGLYCLIGFTDKLRLCNVLMDSIRVFKDFNIKGCTECQFSNGGSMFAAVHVGTIQVYSFHTGQNIVSFRAHAAQINSIYWSLDDTSIISAGADGSVYERKINQPSVRAQEYTQKGCHYNSALCTDEGKIYVVGNDKCLREISDRQQSSKSLETGGVNLTQIVISYPLHRMFFAGTENGAIRSYRFPLTNDWKDFQCHSKRVNRLRITHDDGFLFSAGEDGCLAIFEIHEKDGRISKRDRPDAVPYSKEVLVTRADLEEKHTLMQELKAKVDELTASNEYQLRLHDMNYQEKLKEVSEKFQLQIEHDKSKIEMLRDEKQELEMAFDDKIATVKGKQANELHGADLEHQKDIMAEVTKYQKLQEAMEEDEREYERQTRNREKQHREEVLNMRDTIHITLSEEQLKWKAVESEKEEISKRFAETVRQMEEDTDKEIEELKRKYENKLHYERDATLRLKGENGIMKKKFSALWKDIEDQKEEIKSMEEKEEQLLQHIHAQESKITQHKSDIDERDFTIGEKERKIYDLKKDNQELEKYKFVLDYQIKELKRQIEPRENDITVMNDTVATLDVDLEEFHKKNGNLKEDVNVLRQQLHQKQLEIRSHRQKLRKSVTMLTALKNDLYDVVQYIQDPVKLREELSVCYEGHVKESIQAVEIDPDISKEYKRQRTYLENSVEVLKKKLSRDVRGRKNDNMRVMQENVALIKEINQMRRELKLMHQVQRQRELNTSEAERSLQPVDASWNEKEAKRILSIQKEQISYLRKEVEEWQARLVNKRPISRERLSGMDDYSTAQQLH